MMAELSIREKRMQNSKIGVLESFTLLAQVAELSNKDVDENTQVVGIEVFLRFLRREEEIEDLEYQQ